MFETHWCILKGLEYPGIFNGVIKTSFIEDRRPDVNAGNPLSFFGFIAISML